MRRGLFACLIVLCGLLVKLALELSSPAQAQSAPAQSTNAQIAQAPAAGTEIEQAEVPEVKTASYAARATALADLAAGNLKIVDLSWPLNATSTYWPGDNYQPFQLNTIATLEKDGVLSKSFCSPEHLGTHLDAPSHFERDRPSVDQIPPEQLFAEGVMIDLSPTVEADPNYRVSLDDIQRFEATSGQIPEGAVVLVYTGWSRFWDSPDRYLGKDVMGKLHFPGFSAEAVQFLVDRRQIRGIGLDTLSVDYGESRNFPVHHVLAKAGRYGLENLARLKNLPSRGFFLFIAPIKIETGSGGPTRVFAILP